MTNKAREDFETWILDESSKIGTSYRATIRRSNGQYRENWVQWSWVGWQTSLRIAGSCM